MQSAAVLTTIQLSTLVMLNPLTPPKLQLLSFYTPGLDYKWSHLWALAAGSVPFHSDINNISHSAYFHLIISNSHSTAVLVYSLITACADDWNSLRFVAPHKSLHKLQPVSFPEPPPFASSPPSSVSFAGSHSSYSKITTTKEFCLLKSFQLLFSH